MSRTSPASAVSSAEDLLLLPQIELCNFYGLIWRNLKRNLAIAGFDTVEGYFQQMTGIAWMRGTTSGSAKLYFPVAE